MTDFIIPSDMSAQITNRESRAKVSKGGGDPIADPERNTPQSEVSGVRKVADKRDERVPLHGQSEPCRGKHRRRVETRGTADRMKTFSYFGDIKGDARAR